MGKSKKITIGYKYYLGMHMGLCRGEIDRLLEIKIGDRTAWKGEITQNQQFYIDKPDLFGGTKAEGGVQGDCWVMLGNPGMSVPEKIKGWLGGLVPGFIGTTTMFFDGLVSAMSPYPKPWKMKVTRIFRGWDQGVWYPEKAEIEMTGFGIDGESEVIRAMNPAHIIYQCCVDRNWGRGMPRGLIDNDAFRQAADTLFDEGFGLCIAWNRQDTLDSFVQNILDHIGAALYVDKQTGLFKIKLIRLDYIRSNLPLFDVSTGLLSIEESSLSAGTETINEIVVKWHNPIINQESSVRSQNLASIQTNKATYSKTMTYIGVPTAELAQRLADRDIKYSSIPLRVFQFTCDRRAWRIQPGDVMRIQDPTRSQIDIVVRVSEVDDGVLTDGKIKINAVEDVFTMPLETNVQIQPPLWVPPNYDPSLARRVWYEVPYANLNALFPKGEFAFIGFDGGFYGMGVEKPTPTSMSYHMDLRPNGGQWVRDGFGDFVAVGETVTVVEYLDREFLIDDISDLFHEVDFPCAALMGPEIIIVEKAEIISGTKARKLVVRRGTYDTRPHRHLPGTEVWFYEESIGSDWREYVGGDVVDARALPWTMSGGTLDPDLAPIDTVNMNWRFSRPYVPGLMKANGEHWFISKELSQNTPNILFTWTHRDRVQQQDQMIPHEMGNIGPEPDSSYLIKVYNSDGDVIRTESGIRGTSWNYLWVQAINDLGADPHNNDDEYNIVIRIWTFRDGLESWQYYQVNVKVIDIAAYLMVAKYASQTVQESDLDPAHGISVSKLASITAQESDEGPAHGLSLSKLSNLVNQMTVLPPVIDYELQEYPYLDLVRGSLSVDNSRVMALAARTQDRITDAYDMYTVKGSSKTIHPKPGTNGRPVMVHEAPEDISSWNNAGAQTWTPWIVLEDGLDFLDDTIKYSLSSETDGVPLDLKIGDIIAVGPELMCIKSHRKGEIIVGRGSVDTVPHQHRVGLVGWLYSRKHGSDTAVYEDNDLVAVKVVGHVHTPTPVDPKSVKNRYIEMAYRYKRPYPPGMMLVDRRPWFHSGSTISKDGDVKDVVLTWTHRDRIVQFDEAVDHMQGNIGPEPGVEYKIDVGFFERVRNPKPGQEPRWIILRSALVKGNSWVYQKEWAVPDGRYVTSALTINGDGPCGVVGVTVRVYAYRGDVRSWQGYNIHLTLPSVPCKPGQPPGSGSNPDDPRPPFDGGTQPPELPNNPDPENPENPKPEKPPQPPKEPDPEEPDTDPNPEPEPEPEPDPDPDDDFQGRWGLDWDHKWARDYPPLSK